MKTLQRVKQRRKLMLMELARADILKGDFKKMLASLGYDGSKRTLDPSRFKPPGDTSQDMMQKWVQVAMNVVLGTKLSVDGRIGPITRQAIKRFQRQEGLASHGYIDDRTLQVLELRCGVSAPRGVQHEAIPSLLMFPRRGIWKRDNDKKTKKKSDSKAQEPAAPAEPGILQDEAMKAVAALAFDDEFTADAATTLKRRDASKLNAEMHAWLRLHERAPDARPDWLQRAHDHARAHEERAASIVREQWWEGMGAKR